MNFEPRFPSLPGEQPKLSDEKKTAKEPLPELSLEELASLQQELEELEKEMTYLWEQAQMGDLDDEVEKFKERLLVDPHYVRQGLHYPETRSFMLSIITLVRNSVTNWDPKTHYAERELTGDQKLCIALNEAFIEETPAVEEELLDKESSVRDSVLSCVSDMLDSLNPEQREYAEQMLMKHLPLLQELLYGEFVKMGKPSLYSEVVIAWQEMLLRSERPENLKRACGALKIIWEANQNKNWNDLYRNFFEVIFETRGKSFEFPKDFILKTAVDMAGLNGIEVMKQWMLVSERVMEERYGPSHQYAYGRNLKSLYALKQESPEAPRVLNDEFGITNFDRYTTEMLIRQYEEREEQGPYGIVLFPVSDHNGAFFQDDFRLEQLQLNLAKAGYSLRIIEAETKQDIARRLVTLDRNHASKEGGHKIEFAIIGGHGTKETILFGEGSDESHRVRIKDLAGPGMKRGAGTFFDDGAQVVLFSCSTGVEGGVAQEMSQQFHWRVIGPDKDSHVVSLDVRFEDGKPVLDASYEDNKRGDVNTKVYGTKR